MSDSEFKSIVVSEEELQKRLQCPHLKDHKLFKERYRTEANSKIMINRNGEVTGAKPSKCDKLKPGLFYDSKNEYIYIRLWTGGMISIQAVMRFVFYDEIDSIYDNPFKDCVVDHIDNNKTNNNLSNLRLVSKRFNCYNCKRKIKNKVNELPSDCTESPNKDTTLKCYKDPSSNKIYVELSKCYYLSCAELPDWVLKNYTN